MILPLSFPKKSPSTVFCCAFLADFEIFVRTGSYSVNLHQTKQNVKKNHYKLQTIIFFFTVVDL